MAQGKGSDYGRIREWKSNTQVKSLIGWKNRFLGGRRPAKRVSLTRDTVALREFVSTKSKGLLQPRHALGAWLHKVALRVALRARDTRSRRPEALVEEVAAPLEKDELLWRDVRPVLDEEINGLPDRYRLPFVLCNLEGKTNQEAADALGCPVGTILSRLHWARGRLRVRLERRGVTVGIAMLVLLLEQHAAPAAVAAPLIESCYR